MTIHYFYLMNPQLACFHDIEKLLNSINRLINEKNSAVLIEHIEVIKNADWIIDLGPRVVRMEDLLILQGFPNMIKLRNLNYAARYLKEKYKYAKKLLLEIGK